MKAAKTPLRMEHTREGSAAVIDATGRLIAVMQTVDARLVVESVNNRDLAEQAIYRQKTPPVFHPAEIAELVRGAYFDDTL